MLSGFATVGWCVAPPVPVESYWLKEDELPASTPVEDYNGQPYNKTYAAPPDPGTTVVATRTRNGLESGAYPTLERQLEFELGEPNVCDPVDRNVCNPPTTDEDGQRRCELSTPDDTDPDQTVSTAFNHPAQYRVVTPFTRTTEDGGQTDTALKVGWTAPSAKKGWKGWGWRHVAAKHGWGPDDIVATQIALQSVPTRQSNGTLEYLGIEYEKNGAICTRVVIVADETLADLGEPEAKAIITSYGRFIRWN
ncbi:MAG TPA: hypothetical protein VK501_10960 [Baekduia sp.]|uniref:hypothetical protein n=1 Tax=Baekduia sp. TaxID=2600305 RepID=UPI002BFB20AA|nr:hypothetical protein [Baekduia sp.]HMJ34426.1 hypothetical protein [Baekduia sp.]